ncbi:hypothetical protein F0562_030654 [Nyssa sinensis]|uniref:Protein kinase domain-containing protein n=1 Tax=Nyssa sinensis TaxID=561372 RepID=A0A5J5B3B6_9ASTE|nr:hypothetical protein F0562_030654 [Nyssa sinensis]
MVKFLDDMEREKPIRFTSQQLKIATNNFRNLLGSGGFGSVYKGDFSNGTTVAVKVLNGTSDKRIEEQFMAEVSTIGRIHHFNLVRLYGFCFDKCLRALVYEYMENGSLDKYLFRENKILGFEKLYEIAVGTARGIAYLHEECRQRIIHYDIKPGNILLDAQFCPKVADFGLAKLYNRDNTHISMTGRRGTLGYAAPELWMPLPKSRKCDVYSFGMLLFEIVGRRKNLDFNLPESQQWFPRWVWNKFETGESRDLMIVCAIEEEDKEKAEKMVKVALWCVQYRPESRPLMSVVVKMLEGEVEIPAPLNPFHYLSAGSSPAIVAPMALNGSGFGSGSSQMNQADKLAEDATAETLDEPDWATNLDLCDLINQEKINSVELIRGIKKRIMLKSPRIQYLALVLLETVVKNCEKAFSEVAAERVLDEMVKLIDDPLTVVNNRNKALMLIEASGESSNELRYLPVYEQTYKSLKSRGIRFPGRDDESLAPIFTPPPSVPASESIAGLAQQIHRDIPVQTFSAEQTKEAFNGARNMVSKTRTVRIVPSSASIVASTVRSVVTAVPATVEEAIVNGVVSGGVVDQTMVGGDGYD